jgi:hypothetical protein
MFPAEYRIGRGKARLGRPTRSWAWYNSLMPRPPISMSGRVSRSACMQVTDGTDETNLRSRRWKSENWVVLLTRYSLLSIGRGAGERRSPHSLLWSWTNSLMPRTLMCMRVRASRTRSAGKTRHTTHETDDSQNQGPSERSCDARYAMETVKLKEREILVVLYTTFLYYLITTVP